jgi:hypothetical protein
VFYIVDEKQNADEFSLPLITGRCSTAAAVLLLPLFDCCQFELARRSTPAAVRLPPALAVPTSPWCFRILLFSAFRVFVSSC